MAMWHFGENSLPQNAHGMDKMHEELIISLWEHKITFVCVRLESSENDMLLIAYNIFILATTWCDNLMAKSLYGFPLTLIKNYISVPPWLHECSHSSLFKVKYDNAQTLFTKLIFVPEALVFVVSDSWGWKLQLK
jgi:hypothetical protein